MNENVITHTILLRACHVTFPSVHTGYIGVILFLLLFTLGDIHIKKGHHMYDLSYFAKVWLAVVKKCVKLPHEYVHVHFARVFVLATMMLV